MSAFCFGLASVFGKISYDGGNTAVSMTFYRALISLVIMSFVMVLKKKAFIIEKHLMFKVIILGIFGQTLTTVLINMSYYYIPAGTALTLHFLYPAIVVAVCVFFFKEQVSRIKICVMVVAFLGTLLFFEGMSKGGCAGILFALISGITWAFYIVFMEKAKLIEIEPFLLAFYQCVILAVCCFVWGSAAGEMRYEVSALGWFTMAVSALLFYLAMICLQIGVHLLGSATASILGVFEPISSLFFGFFILHETISIKQTAGTVIILSAVIVLMLENRKLTDK